MPLAFGVTVFAAVEKESAKVVVCSGRVGIKSGGFRKFFECIGTVGLILQGNAKIKMALSRAGFKRDRLPPFIPAPFVIGFAVVRTAVSDAP